MKTLVAGWFSFENGHATAGDLLSRDVACEWLEAAGYDYDVALAAPFAGGVDLQSVDPTAYSHVVFVCGPFQQGELEAKLFGRFNQCRLLGLNLSMRIPLADWSPFDFLVERDSSTGANPDMVFLSRQPLVPLVGVCLVEDYEGAITQVANAAIAKLTASREIVRITIDTRLDENSAGLRSPAEVESLLARMDIVITTRLHGTVLALKNGVPVIAIDPEAGGAKIRRQVELIGWPVIFDADRLSEEALQEAFDYCLTEAARVKASECAQGARLRLEAIREEFIRFLQQPAVLEKKYETRQAAGPDCQWMIPFTAPEINAAEQSAPPEKSKHSLIPGFLRRK